MKNKMFSGKTEREYTEIIDIPLSEIDDFPEHPFKVIDNADMFQLAESIKEHGVISPAGVRLKEDGRYELISGHRRKRACELAGLETMPCEVTELSREEAVIMMVDSNFQRSEVLPSEKAFSCKMRMDALKHQGKRTDLISSPVGTKLSVTEIAEELGESERQVKRYIRLTNLIPGLLLSVDEGKIKLRTAVELSFLDRETQEELSEAIKSENIFPSYSQSVRMRKLFNEGMLSMDTIHKVLKEPKPAGKEKPLFRDSRISERIPPDLPEEEQCDYVIKALDCYNRYLARIRDRDAR